MKKKVIEIDGTEYDVREAKVKDIMHLLGNEDINLGVELAKVCVFVGGEPIGDGVMELGFSTFQQLMEVCNEVNGVGGQGNG